MREIVFLSAILFNFVQKFNCSLKIFFYLILSAFIIIGIFRVSRQREKFKTRIPEIGNFWPNELTCFWNLHITSWVEPPGERQREWNEINSRDHETHWTARKRERMPSLSSGKKILRRASYEKKKKENVLTKLELASVRLTVPLFLIFTVYLPAYFVHRGALYVPRDYKHNGPTFHDFRRTIRLGTFQEQSDAITIASLVRYYLLNKLQALFSLVLYQDRDF